jgi:RNA polymerase sigma-70 factor (ECF subfamily)
METPLTKTMDLVRDAQGGSGDAMNRLFDRYTPRVLKVLRMRMGARLRMRMESQDLLQETFEKVVRRFQSFEMRSEPSLINWLAKLAERTVFEAADRENAKRRDVLREVPLEPAGGMMSSQRLDLEPPAAATVPLDRMIMEEEREVLAACLDELPEHYRQLILLRNFAGKTFEEIRQETGRPSEGAARMMHAKAMRELVKKVAARRGVGCRGSAEDGQLSA